MHYGYTYFLQIMFIILCFIVFFQVGSECAVLLGRGGKHVVRCAALCCSPYGQEAG